MGMLRYHIGQGEREAPATPDHEAGRAGERRAPETESFLQKQEKKRRFQRKHFICRLRGHPLWKGRVSLRATLFFLCFLGTMFVGARGCLASGGEGVTMVPPLFAVGNSTSPSLLAPSLKAETVRGGGERAEESAGDRKTDAGVTELSLGEFEVTAYCNCALCCGIHAGGPTASGTMPEAGRTVAVDPELIPLGTELLIDGERYLAEDTGRLIKGKIIDIYFDTHEEAMRYGRQNKKVYIRKTEEGGGR